MKFQITRTDINKIVVKPYEFKDEEQALGEYISILMLAGIIPMNKSVAEEVSPHNYRLSNGWMIEVAAA